MSNQTSDPPGESTSQAGCTASGGLTASDGSTAAEVTASSESTIIAGYTFPVGDANLAGATVEGLDTSSPGGTVEATTTKSYRATVESVATSPTESTVEVGTTSSAEATGTFGVPESSGTFNQFRYTSPTASGPTGSTRAAAGAESASLAVSPTTRDFGTIRRTVRFGIDDLKHRIDDGFRAINVDETLTATSFGFPREIFGRRLDELRDAIEDGFRDLRQELDLEPRGRRLPYCHRYPTSLENRQAAQIRQLRADIERLQRANGGGNSSASADAFQAHITALDETIERLTREVEELTEQNNLRVNQLTDHDRDLQIHDFHVTDNHINTIHERIGNTARGISIHNCIADASAQPVIPAYDHTRRALLQRTLLVEWSKGLSTKQLQYRIQSTLCQFIEEIIGDSHWFGLTGFDWTSNEIDVERSLQVFESALRNMNQDGSHDASIGEWRVRTIQCADRLLESRPAQANRAEVEEINASIEQLLAPIIESQITQDLRDSIRALARDCVQLALILRLSRDRFWFEMPGDGTTVVDGRHSRLYVDVPDDAPSEGPLLDIAFSVKGMLLRQPWYRTETRVVSQAWIVVHGPRNPQPAAATA